MFGTWRNVLNYSEKDMESRWGAKEIEDVQIDLVWQSCNRPINVNGYWSLLDFKKIYYQYDNIYEKGNREK